MDGDYSPEGRRLKLPSSELRQYRRERWAAAFFAALVAVVLLLCNALAPLENGLIEMRARLLDRAPTGQIAIIEIDAKSIAAFKNWPWSRRRHADLIDRLHALGASIIAFDVDFSAESDRNGDEAFTKALRRAEPVILPIFEQRASEGTGERLMLKNRPASPFGAAWVGSVNILPDHDGVVRDFPAAIMIDGTIQPSMAVLLTDNNQLGDRTFQPDWSIDLTHIPRFSFVDVLEGRVAPNAIAGKRIIVGATAIELGDRYTIPRFGTVPGVVVQALAAESLLQHRAVSRLGIIPTSVGLCLIVLLLGIEYQNSKRSFPAVAFFVLAVLLAGPVLAQAWTPVSIDTAGLLTTTLIGIGLRLLVETRQRHRLDKLSDRDTTLPNIEALEALLLDRTDAHVTVIAASIDRFETIRTALGSHRVAGLVNEVAERLREVSTGEIYRVSPDTLAWVVEKEAVADQVLAAAKDRFLEPFTTDQGPIDVRLTFGMAGRGTSTNLDSLVEQSLAAVNSARSEGCSSRWFRGVANDVLRDLSIMGELRRGMSKAELFVAYQPKLDLRTGTISHAEALVRWRHPTDGLIPPDRFLPLAEETGAVRELTRYVLRHVLSECSQLRGSLSNLGISVNVSATDIAEPEFADEIIETLASSAMDPSLLTLEITESAIISSHETALKSLQALRRHLVQLSIDDYGTGQSTLSYIKKLPVDELKIDKSFVTSMCTNAGDRIMVRSTIGMAHELGLRVVAEGVEDSDTLKLLTKLECDYAQGFYIGRAVSFEELCFMADKGSRLRKIA